ncbi:related to actin cytoskeleton organization and biogenesis [Rhynchosporium agropyri]|uniref:Related to actin cytoskeleton organization and biogenesis n=1 Tax=Rhynchosporium agropyri TaxID=914238 RepID=A0A1E1K113_9HELO|nr:related to actin cytoskeleton organization and biogenesis [Rhynchosporium agropyri]
MAHLVRDAKAVADTAKGLGRAVGGSFMENKTRRERKFGEVEDSLPNVKAAPASDNRPSSIWNVLSFLGSWNPLAQPVTENDTVWLLDNTAYRSASGKWQAEFVAAVFDKDTGVEISTIVADIAEKVGLGNGDVAEATIRERLMPFVQTILPGRKVTIEFAKQQQITLAPGGRNGISSDTKAVPTYPDGTVVSYVAKVPQGANGVLQANTVYAEPEGWGVVSDIDDTIKITQTSDPIGILRSTFVSQATPVAGMPDLYEFIQRIISPTSPWFYLSASPYNLYSFLHDFRRKFFPQGTIILRDASWMNLGGLLSNLTLGTQEYKVSRITKINTWLPKRKMILIGDSTQADPETYGEIYRKHKGWVKLILIRKVTDIAALGIEEKNEPKRFEKAFKDVPKDIWHVFETPDECYPLIKTTVARG